MPNVTESKIQSFTKTYQTFILGFFLLKWSECAFRGISHKMPTFVPPPRMDGLHNGSHPPCMDSHLYWLRIIYTIINEYKNITTLHMSTFTLTSPPLCTHDICNAMNPLPLGAYILNRWPLQEGFYSLWSKMFVDRLWIKSLNKQ